MPLVSQKVLESLCIRIFGALGVSSTDGAVISRYLVDADLSGYESHGVRRIPAYVQGVLDKKIDPAAKLEILRESSTTAVLDAHWGFGQVMARQAAFLAISKANEMGVSAIGLKRASHVGRLGPHIRLLAEENLVGIGMMNHHGGGQVMAPFGGIERRLSPSPLAIALPRKDQSPILLDISMSVLAEGKLQVMQDKGEDLPLGRIMDNSGHPTTLLSDFYNDLPGSILPLGGDVAGHKGFGLALIIDMITGTLTGAGCSREGDSTVGNALFLIGIKIEKFISLETYYTQVEDLIRYVKSSKIREGFEGIYIPGEMEVKRKRQNMAQGIMLSDELWNHLKIIADLKSAS